MIIREFYTTGQVAERLGMLPWKLAYLVERGVLRGPTMQIPGRRLFTESDVKGMQDQLVERERGQM